jgi:hypothetical protein
MRINSITPGAGIDRDSYLRHLPNKEITGIEVFFEGNEHPETLNSAWRVYGLRLGIMSQKRESDSCSDIAYLILAALQFALSAKQEIVSYEDYIVQHRQ